MKLGYNQQRVMDTLTKATGWAGSAEQITKLAGFNSGRKGMILKVLKVLEKNGLAQSKPSIWNTPLWFKKGDNDAKPAA